MSFIHGLGRNFTRRPDQIWVSQNIESAINRLYAGYIENSRVMVSEFNWTVAQSDKATFKWHAHDSKYSESELVSDSQIEQNIVKLNKSKTLCWIMSNCGYTWTPRVRLAANLLKVFPGTLHFWGDGSSCLSKGVNTEKLTSYGWLGHSLTHKTIQDCKFYLAFENSNCTDYITEKFWNALNAYAIPIVNGWPHSYEKLLPGEWSILRHYPRTISISKLSRS